MDSKSYHIPHACRSYSRELRPYIPRPPAPRSTPAHRPPPKIRLQHAVVPKVAKLQQVVRYTPKSFSPIAKPTLHPPTARPATPARPVPPDSPRPAHQRSADDQRVQKIYQEDQRRRQVEHQRQQERIQREHQRRQDLDRDRLQDAARRENQRRDRSRSAEQRRTNSDRPRPEPPSTHSLEIDHPLEDLPPTTHTRQQRPPAKSVEQLKAEIRRKLTAQTNDRANADDDDATPAPPESSADSKKGSCAGNIVFFLIVGTILYFTVCSGIIDEFFG